MKIILNLSSFDKFLQVYLSIYSLYKLALKVEKIGIILIMWDYSYDDTEQEPPEDIDFPWSDDMDCPSDFYDLYDPVIAKLARDLEFGVELAEAEGISRFDRLYSSIEKDFGSSVASARIYEAARFSSYDDWKAAFVAPYEEAANYAVKIFHHDF